MSDEAHTALAITLARWCYRIGGVVACVAGVLLLANGQKLIVGALLVAGGGIAVWHSFSSRAGAVAKSARNDLETW